MNHLDTDELESGEISDMLDLGKKFCHNVISGSKFAAQPCHDMMSTPVIHCRMRGVAIDENFAVLGSVFQAVRSLYVARKVVEGVHDNNRLSENSLWIVWLERQVQSMG